MKQPTHHSVDKVMQSMDGVQRAKAPGYLYAKILSGVYSRQTITIWERVSSFIARPAVALACIVLVVAVNALIIYSGSTEPVAQGIASAEAVDLYAYDIFNTENIEP